MEILANNIKWMSFNAFLAIVPLVFGYISLKADKNIVKFISFFIWLLFIPNTIYVFTDIIHIPSQLVETRDIERIILIFEYLILLTVGFFTFILCVYFFERQLKKLKIKNFSLFLMVFMFNLLIGFGIVLGRIEKLNSWEVATDMENVIVTSLNVLSSDQKILLSLLFGLFNNAIYFLGKNSVVRLLKPYLRKELI